MATPTVRQKAATGSARQRAKQVQAPSQRAIDRGALSKTAKGREQFKGKAGKGPERTIGRRTDGRPESALVKRRTGERQLALRNRGIADRPVRTPAQRALARATFGGKFADRIHDRRNWRHWRHWRNRHHHVHVIGWIGPLFWPFAYDDFIDYTFWPYAYDAFWPYAYDDVYEGFFGPYAVGGPAYAELPPAAGAPRTGTRTATGRTAARGAGRPAAASPGIAAAQICTGEASGLTDWPVEQIAETVNPDETQRAALNELRDAAASAVKLMQSACPDDLPSTPSGRMAAMRQRLEAMRQAVQIVRPALDKFYESLTDEQKARFNVIEPDETAADQKARKTELSQACSSAVAKASDTPIARIRQALRPTPEQQTALDNLNAANAKAAEILAANCPTDEALTPPGRLAAMEARLDAMLKSLDVVQPALTQFYDSLSDEQKARFNQLGVRQQAGR